MLQTLRKFRKTFINQKASRKYLVYAIGEIILVVIGILIALQINNWNEIRKTRALEKYYLEALQTEFEINLDKIDNLIVSCDRILLNAKELLEYTHPEQALISEIKFSELAFRSLLGELKYRPSKGVITEIISSAKLDIFESKSLRTQLASWDSHLERITFQEDVEHGRIRLQLVDFLTKKGNWRFIVSSRIKSFGFEPSKFATNNLTVLNSEEFENLLIGFYATGKFLNEGYYKNVKEEIEQILENIKSEIEK